MCTCNTQSGSSKFACWGIRPPGDLLKECRCFLSSTTLWNDSNNIISQSFVPQSGTQERTCHLHPWWLGLWSFSSDLVSRLEIITTGFFHLYEAPDLETIDIWESLHHLWSGIFGATGKDTYVCFPLLWQTKAFNRCVHLLGILDNFF